MGMIDRQFKTYIEMASSHQRENAEGYVFFPHNTNQMIKFKFEEYKRLHKILNSLNEKNIWDMMMLGESVDEKFKNVPDEFHSWVKDVSFKIKENYKFEKNRLISEYQKIRQSSTEFDVKKNFALAISEHKDRSALFALYNDKNIEEIIWKNIKPKTSNF